MADDSEAAIRLVCGDAEHMEPKHDACRKWMWLPDGGPKYRVTGLSIKAFAHFTAYLSTLVTTKKPDVAALVLHPEDLQVEEAVMVYRLAQIVDMQPLAILLADHINKVTPEKSTSEMATWLDSVGIQNVNVAVITGS